MQQVLVAVSHLAGDEFLRTTARYVRCDRKTVSNCLDRVFTALEKLKPKYVRLPTAAEEEASAAEIKRLYNLEKVAYGIDCVHMVFNHRPHKILGENQHADQFYNRKGRFSLNVQVIADGFQLIRDIDVKYPGSVHDSRIWTNSMARIHMPGRQYFLAADAGYALSDSVLKRYDEPANPAQRLFNYRLCQACVKMTECLYGMWKPRFPVLTNMRFCHLNAMRAVVATAVLMNFWMMERLSLEFPPIERLPNVLVVDERPAEQASQAGVNTRNDYVSRMVGPQTRRERRVWNGEAPWLSSHHLYTLFPVSPSSQLHLPINRSRLSLSLLNVYLPLHNFTFTSYLHLSLQIQVKLILTPGVTWPRTKQSIALVFAIK